MARTVSSGLLLVLTVAALSASAQTISYDALAQPGNQAFGGNLGLDFDVNATIVVSSLGAFNSNAPGGFVGTVQVAIFDRNTTLQVGGSVSLTGTAGTLINGDRFQTLLTPIVLPAGNYSIVAVGFSAADLNGNSNISGFTPSTENTGGGLISFVGSGRYDGNTTLDFPALLNGGPSNAFLAGTFQFAAAGTKPTISKAFGVGTITAGQTTSLTFTLGNPSGNPSLSVVAFSDTLPNGLKIAANPAVSNTCSGSVTADPGTDTISLSNGSLADATNGATSCTIVVNILAKTPGQQVNTTSTLTSTQAPAGTPATASILVLPKDAVQVSYSANLKAGDSYIDLTSVGYNTSAPVADTDICANVYVFDDAQELIACCTCPLTLNHLKTLSALNDLVSNTLTPGVPADITTMLVASSGTCNASAPGPLVGGLRAWSTTLHAAPSGQYVVTEVPFSDVPWSTTEYAKLTKTCGFVQANGSGYGICSSCVQGAAGAKKQ